MFLNLRATVLVHFGNKLDMFGAVIGRFSDSCLTFALSLCFAVAVHFGFHAVLRPKELFIIPASTPNRMMRGHYPWRLGMLPKAIGIFGDL